MTTDEKIAVLQAFKEGKTIQYTVRGCGLWGDTASPCWDFNHYDYRIKPEEPKPKYRPYQSAEEVMEAIKEHGTWVKRKREMYQIVGLAEIIVIGNSYAILYEDSLEELTWPDGTPFGVKEE